MPVIFVVEMAEKQNKPEWYNEENKTQTPTSQMLNFWWIDSIW